MVNAFDEDLTNSSMRDNARRFINQSTINPYTTGLLKKGIVERKQAPDNLIITRDNLKLYKWSKKQLLDHFFNNLLDFFFKR